MAGFKTVGQCEWAEFQTKILEKHWPNVPRWRDIRTLTGESFYERTGLRTVDVISGGFPCQPFSVAGKHGGQDDDRYLWPEMLRIIHEIRPGWVIGENVPGIVNMALDKVLSDLENEGFETQPFIIPACGVDAPHRRERVCILAYANGKQLGKHGTQEPASENDGAGKDNSGGISWTDSGKRRENQSGTCRVADGIQTSIYEIVADAESKRLQGYGTEQVDRGGCYRHQLPELLEATPRGITGRVNPEWIEWLMGYPIGWTELNH